MSSNKLGEFIRLHREQLKPQDVGLPSQGRRRTPGLRREELAQLCGVSPTWLTWLEQGRTVSPSAKVLAKLAELMNLTAAERAYLFRLADKLDPMPPNKFDDDAARVSERSRLIVDAIKTPAYIMNRRWDVIGWNRSAKNLFVGWLDQFKTRATSECPNLLTYMFLNPQARKLIVDWPDRAQRVVAEFRAECGKYEDQEPFLGLINELKGNSAEFRRAWNAQRVVSREGGTRRFMHPDKGALVYEQVTLHFVAWRETKLVMLLPA